MKFLNKKNCTLMSITMLMSICFSADANPARRFTQAGLNRTARFVRATNATQAIRAARPDRSRKVAATKDCDIAAAIRETSAIHKPATITEEEARARVLAVVGGIALFPVMMITVPFWGPILTCTW